MSALLQRIMIALGRRGEQTPIDDTLGTAYRALQRYQDAYPNVFPHASEILLAEIEGGATKIADIPRRIGHICQMLDRLHRQEELDAWAAEEDVIVVG
jgi:hypothetical protein